MGGTVFRASRLRPLVVSKAVGFFLSIGVGIAGGPVCVASKTLPHASANSIPPTQIGGGLALLLTLPSKDPWSDDGRPLPLTRILRGDLN